MQERAMALMGKKLTAAQALEGKFSSEGLAAMAGEDGSVELALAKSLVEHLDEGDARRIWKRIGNDSATPERDASEPTRSWTEMPPERSHDWTWLFPDWPEPECERKSRRRKTLVPGSWSCRNGCCRPDSLVTVQTKARSGFGRSGLFLLRTDGKLVRWCVDRMPRSVRS
jgi:hypothetical protein